MPYATALDEVLALRSENAKLRTALTKIAAYDDVRASDRLAANGSYGAFDEPGSVEVARKTLEELTP